MLRTAGLFRHDGTGYIGDNDSHKSGITAGSLSTNAKEKALGVDTYNAAAAATNI